MIGSATRAFDIAANAGAQVGSYANLSNLPIGTTFTHVRATVDLGYRHPRVGGRWRQSDVLQQRGGGGSASAASSATFAGGPAQNSTVYVPHVGSYSIGGGTTALTEADFQTSGSRGYIKRPDDSDVLVTYQLSAPYTPTRNQQPQVTVKFDVTGAVGVLFTGICEMFPEPPSVSITVR